MTKVLKKLEWFYNQAGWVAGGLAAIMMIATVREVIGRYAFHSPTLWSIELSGYLLVGLVYLGAAYTTLIEGHVRIDLLYGKFKGKRKAIVDIAISVLAIAYCTVLVWQGGILAWDSLAMHATSAEAMMWPLFPSQVLVPIGAFLTILVFIGKIYYSLGSLHKGGS